MFYCYMIPVTARGAHDLSELSLEIGCFIINRQFVISLYGDVKLVQ